MAYSNNDWKSYGNENFKKLYELGFRLSDRWPKWVWRLINTHDPAQDDPFDPAQDDPFDPDHLGTKILDHPRLLTNHEYVIYLFTPYRSIDELNRFVANSQVIIPEFLKRGFSTCIMPSMYHKQKMISMDGGIYGSLLFIRRKNR